VANTINNSVSENPGDLLWLFLKLIMLVQTFSDARLQTYWKYLEEIPHGENG